MDMKEHQTRIVMALTPYLYAFPSNKMTEKSLVIYAKALSELSIAEIDAAMLKILRMSRFFPAVSEIFEQAENMRLYANTSEKPTPDEAWREAMGLAKHRHLYSPWEYSCPEVEKAVQHFGKVELCSLEKDAVNTARAQFMRIYSSVLQKEQDRSHNEAVMKNLPQSSVQELVAGLAEGMALGVGK